MLNDDHRDPPWCGSEAVRRELAAERLLDRWVRGLEPDMTESIDLDALLRSILFRGGQVQADAIHRAEIAVRAAAMAAARNR